VNELLEFENGSVGLALNLDEETIGAVVLGQVEELDEGQVVRATGRILSIPVGDGMLGRVVNPLGIPVDGKGALTDTVDRRIEIQAPGIVNRQPVREPLQTGIKVIDAMTPSAAASGSSSSATVRPARRRSPSTPSSTSAART